MKQNILVLVCVFVIFAIVYASANPDSEISKNVCYLEMVEFEAHKKWYFCRTDFITSGQDFNVGSDLDTDATDFIVSTNSKLNFLPRDVGQKFPNLGSYSATECGLKVIRSHYFKGMKNLKELDLSYNRISTIESGAFRDLKRLDQLCLKNNMIERLDGKVFTKLAKLDSIELQHNQIKYLSPLTFKIPKGQLSDINLTDNICVDREYESCEFDDNLDNVYCNFKRLERDVVANCTAIDLTVGIITE